MKYNLSNFFSRSSKLEARSSRQRGVTLLDTVVGSALMLVVFVGIAGVFQLSVDVVTNNKARAGAIALANERMEYIRSLAYASVGTVGGIPAGAIAQSETVSSNGVSYTRRTVVLYVDDPKDGISAADTDGVFIDYKIAKVDVAWTSRIGTRHITLVTRLEPAHFEVNGAEPSCSQCGTLTVDVRNKAELPVSNAQVHVVNASANPTVDVTTFSNTNGLAVLAGAPAVNGYQITVTKTGYSSDQTYPSTPPQNVPLNGTQTFTAHIDLLSTKFIYTFIKILPGTWADTMDDTSKIATSTNITVTVGSAKLSGSAPYPSYGELQSIAIGPSYLATWQSLSWINSQPAGTSIRYRVYDGSGTTLIPESQLLGNSAGFTTSPIDMTNISTSTFPAIRVGAIFSSTGANTPSLDSFSIANTVGPMPLPSLPFTLTGAKIINNGPPIVYKYNTNLNSGASSGITLPNMEYDIYSMAVPSSSGYDIASACHPQAEYVPEEMATSKFNLAPGTETSTYLYLAPHTTNSLLVDVKSSNVLVPNATTTLSLTGFNATTTTDSCGQAFFSGLSATTYTVTVTATGHPVYTNTTNVSGTSRFSATIN